LQEVPWPTDGWTYSSPEAQGMDNETLTNMMDFIAEREYPIHSVLVIRNGYAVFERYPHEYYTASHLTLLHSVTKSFVGTLVGIAIQQGLLDSVDENVLDFFPEYEVANPGPMKDDMTIEDLLTMTPGLDWDEWSSPYESGTGNTLIEMMESPDSVQYVLDRPMSDTPGEHWVYNGGASVLLGAIVQQISNQSTYDFAREYLFGPLGIQYSTWYGLSGGWCNTMGGLRLMTRDMAKLGLLYLNNGTWNGTQILPSEYIANATLPIGLSNPLGPAFDYGWHWWMRSDLGIYFAYGRYGQKIMVAPEYNLVVAFTAYVPDDGYDPEFNLFRDYILQSINGVAGFPTVLLAGLSVAGVGALVIVALVFRRMKKQ
jgi:CubicO group peptidase (beta-lactamase class C family)